MVYSNTLVPYSSRIGTILKLSHHFSSAKRTFLVLRFARRIIMVALEDLNRSLNLAAQPQAINFRAKTLDRLPGLIN